MPNAPSVPGSVPQQPAMEVDEPHPLMIMAAKLMSHTRTDDQSDPATSAAEMEVDFGGDQDEVEPETLQDPWLRDTQPTGLRVHAVGRWPGRQRQAGVMRKIMINNVFVFVLCL